MKTTAAALSLVAVIGLLLIGAGSALADKTERNEEAIKEVLAGKSKVAKAAWWGYDPVEATAALQAAIDSGAEKVIVEKMSGPWIVDKIQLAGNQELFFEPGVVVQAKKGAFRGKSDALMSAWNKTGVKLTGYKATLRMHREDYDSPDYEKAEWRHVLNFHGCTDVVVVGLTLSDSGGDGIYLGTGRDRSPNRNVVIRDVVCDRNYRQGISVITVENLLIENCVLKNTAGTPPAAGIDFEPNRPTEKLVNCVMRNCTIEDNQGYAIHVYAGFMDATSAPISIRLEKCTTRGTNARSVSIATRCGKKGPVKGKVELVDCRFEDMGKTGVYIRSKPPEGVRVRMANCTLADPAEDPAVAAPILFGSRRGDLMATGGLELVDCTIHQRADRPVMKFDDFSGNRLRGVTGTLAVVRDGRRTAYTIDQKLIDRWVPYDPIVEIPLVGLEGRSWEPLGKPSAEPVGKISGHRVRRAAIYLLHAAKGDNVSLRLKHRQVGRYAGKPLKVQVLGPAGGEVAQATIALGEEAACSFTAAEGGTYRIACQPDRHTVQVVESSHPICIASEGGTVHLLGTTGDFYFWVPPGTERFGLRFRGQGEGERFSAAVFDADGRQRWERRDISETLSFLQERKVSDKGEVWRLQLSRPGVGVLEDCTVQLRGVPPVLGFSAEGLLRPAD